MTEGLVDALDRDYSAGLWEIAAGLGLYCKGKTSCNKAEELDGLVFQGFGLRGFHRWTLYAQRTPKA